MNISDLCKPSYIFIKTWLTLAYLQFYFQWSCSVEQSHTPTKVERVRTLMCFAFQDNYSEGGNVDPNHLCTGFIHLFRSLPVNSIGLIFSFNGLCTAACLILLSVKLHVTQHGLTASCLFLLKYSRL